jgi:hypothetical protein
VDAHAEEFVLAESMWECQVVPQSTLEDVVTDSLCFVSDASLQISIRNQLLVANDW